MFRKAAIIWLLAVSPCLARQISFAGTGATNYGTWSAQADIAPAQWEPGSTITIRARLHVSSQHLAAIRAARIPVGGFAVLATAERTFDSSGHLRFVLDDRMSTLLTPSGLPIEGGIDGAATNRFGYSFRTPVDVLAMVPVDQAQRDTAGFTVAFDLQATAPQDIPPGLYRVRLDYGFTAGENRFYSLNAEAFARRSLQPAVSHHYSPPIPVNGFVPSGAAVDAGSIRPRLTWVLLYPYNSNGYSGVVAEEDRGWFNLSQRNLIHDDVILPRFDEKGRPLRYSLEPQFPMDETAAQDLIPWNYGSGEWSVQVTAPDGSVTNLGTCPFRGRSGQGPTTQDPRFTAWQPPGYGRYTVRAHGWIEDIWGRRYTAGGTYPFWIAKRMTLATATFQGMAYPVGERYGHDLAFAPAVPAEVEVTATLFPDSDPRRARTVTSRGRASASGIFGAAQGLKALPLDVPGEYYAHVLARYTDPEGHSWVCTMRHAGVVYPPSGSIAAHGKKLAIQDRLVDRGETHLEASDVPSTTGEYRRMRLGFPYRSGDVLLIASDPQAGNYIDPALTFSDASASPPYDTQWNEAGASNLRIRTSNGLSPHLFPEFITGWAYYYSAAPRPGFMGRFLVAEDGAREPQWVTTPNSFGEQINASANGDLPGDIYRLIGGVAVRKAGAPAAYAGYLASAFLLPLETHNNRVIAPGTEDLLGPDGSRARLWLAGTRPGMVYEAGASFLPAVQIDPVLPATVIFTLHDPRGRTRVARGDGGALGIFAGAGRWTLDLPGVYRYTIEASWDGHKGYMPGLPRTGGEFYVIEKNRPPGATGLRLNLPAESSFPVESGVEIFGTSTASSVRYSALIPGAVIGQGTLPVRNGKFRFFLDPQSIHRRFPIYDTLDRGGFTPEVKDVIHLTFFSQETGPRGTTYHTFVRLVIRGNRILYTR